MKLTVAIPVIAAVCLVSAADAQKVTKPPAAHAPAAHAQRPETPPPKPRQDTPEGGPASPQNLEKLLKLSPEQRDKALSSLPPGRRNQILAKLENYQKVPPQQRARELDRLQRLQTLPPQKRSQVRASLQKLQTIPQPRHQQIQRQINQLRDLPDSDRRALMNSEEFRSKFTPSEQQMIEDIMVITPRG
jgi:hypothetical protein